RRGSGRRAGTGHRGLPPLSNNQRRSTRPAQRMTRGIVANLWLIPAVPLAASLIILSLANSRRNAAATLAIVGQIVALALSILAFSLTLQTYGFRAVHNFTWFVFGEQALRIGWLLDPLAAAMLVMIALVDRKSVVEGNSVG